WRANLDDAAALVRKAVERLGDERVFVGPSCSLLHVPVDLEAEDDLDEEVGKWLAFARQKLDEIRALAVGEDHDDLSRGFFRESREAKEARRSSARVVVPSVRNRLQNVTPEMTQRD